MSALTRLDTSSSGVERQILKIRKESCLVLVPASSSLLPLPYFPPSASLPSWLIEVRFGREKRESRLSIVVSKNSTRCSDESS
jgi:hypothetical protein